MSVWVGLACWLAIWLAAYVVYPYMGHQLVVYGIGQVGRVSSLLGSQCEVSENGS